MHICKTLFVVTLFVFSFMQQLFAQDTKSFHVDSTGRLFVNPGTPVNIYISTSPDGKNAVRLRSAQPNSEPMYWDGHGFHFLTHLNLYLGRKIRFDLFADGRPPKTSSSFDPKLGVQKGDVIYLSGASELELSAIDPFSGVSGLFYSVNSSEFVPYVKPVAFDKDGEYVVRFYAIDNVGNREDEGERVIHVDTTPPVTKLSIDGSHHENVVSSRTRFVLDATDALGVRETMFAINNSKPSKYSKAISLAALPEGEHVITWYSVDIVGNVEEPQSYTFFVDRTPPMVFEEIMGNTYMVAGREYSSGRSQLKIVAVDNKAGVKSIYYSLNNQPFQLYEKPIFLSEITAAVSVRSYSVDNVDNKGVSDTQGQQFSMPEVDITGPGIKHSFIGSVVNLRDTVWIGPSTRIAILANDQGAGVSRIEYRLNEQATAAYSDPFSVTSAGNFKLQSTAWDNVDNLNVASTEFSVDTEAPLLHIHFSVKPTRHTNHNGESIGVYSAGMNIFLGATDNKVGLHRIVYSLNGSAEKEYNQPLVGFKANSVHAITVEAFDKLGNVKEQTVRFMVE